MRPISLNKVINDLALMAIISLSLFIGTVEARGKGGGSVHVNGYVKKDGTYVAPHERSSPDGNFYNNWSTVGNTNPYTGKEGTLITPKNGSSVGGGYSPITPINSNLPIQSTNQSNNSSPITITDPLSTDKPKSNINPQLPPHSKIDFTGHNWECENGYSRAGNQCNLIQLPNNAKIDFTGHNWECEWGYRRNGNTCIVVGQ